MSDRTTKVLRYKRRYMESFSNFELLLEHDSKAQPPVCILWYPLHITCYKDGGRTMQRPLVSKFLCYLEAAARRELVGTPARVPSILLFKSSAFQWVSAQRGRVTRVVRTSPEQLSQLSSFLPHPLCRQSHPIRS